MSDLTKFFDRVDKWLFEHDLEFRGADAEWQRFISDVSVIIARDYKDLECDDDDSDYDADASSSETESASLEASAKRKRPDEEL